MIIWPFLLIPSLPSWGQAYYWVAFTDKDGSPWSLSKPEEYLSMRALERRQQQGIPIDSLDLPVNSCYVNQVLDLGATLVHASRWLNGITVKSESGNFEDKVRSLPFVREVQCTKKYHGAKSTRRKFKEPLMPDETLDIDTSAYGGSALQVAQLNGQFLHNQDFRGTGMHIAVLDAGFYNADIYPAFDSLWAGGQILGVHDFVSSEPSIFDSHYHGMSVLSIMGGNVPGQMIGTAPEASYWLLRSEDIYSENLIEEDNWVAAAEFADSAGVDIINSSLGYFLFDDPAMNHTYAEMDGRTTRVTRAANVAASRGMLVVASAGNEGSEANWNHIIAPSDGDSVIGVGAVNSEGIPAVFTSRGPASDGDVKPNVAAMGFHTVLQNRNGMISSGNGTSYSSPVVAGLAACLWQANPHSTAFQVKDAIERSAHLYGTPDSLIGYGIPDMKIADQILKTPLLEQWENGRQWLLYPNPVNNYLVLQKNGDPVSGPVEINFFSLDGRLLRKEKMAGAQKIMAGNLQSLPTGMLILQIISNGSSDAVKIFKSP